MSHYDLALDVTPATDLLDAIATIRATATQPLTQFDLDLLGLEVQALKVDGADARYERHGGELVVTPARPLAVGQDFTISVLYRGSPEPRSTKAIPIAVGWISTGDSTFTIDEPEGASTWFPANDHPSDKATYSFHITVPAGVTAVANGDLVNKTTAADGRTTWNYDERAPMASYLAQVAVGDYVLESDAGPNGITIRNAFASGLADDARPHFTRTADMLQFFGDTFGPYPFDVYGVLVVNERTQFQLETQTLSLFDSSYVANDPGDDTTVAHELAHQWFGDDVTPSSWKDIWLSEGFATYAEWLWTEHTGGATAHDSAQRTRDGLGPKTAPPGDPGVDHMFDVPAVYARGALTLEAVRRTIGDEAFFTALRTYVARFSGKNVTTNDFIDVVDQASGRDLHDLFDQWLYRAEVPALPAS